MRFGTAKKQVVANRWLYDCQQTSKHELIEAAKREALYALIDPAIKLPGAIESAPLQFRDTDPLFFEMIAWDKVRFRAPTLARVTPEHFEWLAESLPLERWGFFITSSFSFWSV